MTKSILQEIDNSCGDSLKLKLHKIADFGYNANIFTGKEEQMVQVAQHLKNCGFLPKELVENEVNWFYT